MSPASARGRAVSTAARKACASGMTWSDGARSMRPPGARSRSQSAAASAAGAVLRPSGSIRMAAGDSSTAASCSVTMKRKASPVTITGAANPGPDSRRAEAWNRLSAPVSRENCLG